MFDLASQGATENTNVFIVVWYVAQSSSADYLLAHTLDTDRLHHHYEYFYEKT